MDDTTKTSQTATRPYVSRWKETMREMQTPQPTSGVFQITTAQGVRRLVLPKQEVLYRLLDDDDYENNPKYTGVMPGIQASFTIQGIGGMRTFMMFLVRNLPSPYSSKNIVFQILDIVDTIDATQWNTTINAGVIPLRGAIKVRLGIP